MKQCKNCGSPVHGYADHCGGYACRGSMEADYMWQCQTCGNEFPAENHSVSIINMHCQGCKRRTMHYLVRR